MKSDITNNITEIDQQKRKFLSDISDMRKSFNDHLDKIEKQTVKEMVSVEKKLQVQLKNVLVHNTGHFVHSYESLEVTSIFLYFIHILPDMIKISSFGFHGNQYIL
jgi:hypothetical protein